MVALLVTAGSHGDIHPFIAIARALIDRGHSATIATNPYFQAQIERAGIAFAPLTERAELKELITQHKVMDAARGPLAVMRQLVLPYVPRFIERTRELIAEISPAVLVYHPIVIGASWAAEQAGLPTVSISPTPLVWANPADPMVLLPHRSHNPHPMAVRFDLWLGRVFLRLAMDPGLNRIRRSIGLPPRRDNFHRDCAGGTVNLGIWSPVLRPPTPGDPPNARITGFCWHDRDHTQEAADASLRAFLDSGPPPLVFALGSTGVHAAGRFYHHASEAARRLGVRALLVVGRDQPAPANLPPGSMAVPYAPFSTVFPRAAAVVHHGGAGTTAQAMRAGKPTLITPMAHDQFDNAARIKRLGAGETLRFKRVNARSLERALHAVLSDATFARNAAFLRRRLVGEDGAPVAAEAIEHAAARGTPVPALPPSADRYTPPK